MGGPWCWRALPIDRSIPSATCESSSRWSHGTVKGPGRGWCQAGPVIFIFRVADYRSKEMCFYLTDFFGTLPWIVGALGRPATANRGIKCYHLVAADERPRKCW
ncbi:hypothetical protein PAHAL_9G576700 [Panicum hallii]|uniref:Uncharacterized protein n=1 Tax=Panicum hallii TaxID=206008 RepID=A0A2T8I632_9POAL|nr:hypothetical protein PAHAL_9G576700 [Panicum hallii]